MAVPTSRSTFKEFCLRKLGKPVIEINVDDDQVEDRIDESLRYYWDYHFDGAERLYYKHLITSTDIANKYITLPQNIIGAVKIFPVGQSLNTMNLFNLRCPQRSLFINNSIHGSLCDGNAAHTIHGRDSCWPKTNPI